MRIKFQITNYKIQIFCLVIGICFLIFLPQGSYAQTCGSSATKLAEGLVSAPDLGSGSTFTTTGGCIVSSKAALAPFSIPTYADLKSKYYTQSKSPICTGSNYPCKNSVSASTSLPGFSGDQIFSYSGNLTIDASSPSSGSGIQIIFIEGSLTFNSNYIFKPAQGGTVFIVKGNVNIVTAVSEINAVVITEGIICTAFDGSNCPAFDTLASQLIIFGSLISINQSDAVPLKFRRTLADNSIAAEKIIQQNKYIVLLKDLLSDTTQKWSEITGSINILPIPPCVNGYKDADGDGYGAGTYACFPSGNIDTKLIHVDDCDDTESSATNGGHVYQMKSTVRDADLDGKTAQTTLSSNCVGNASGSAYKDINDSPTWLTTATNPADCNDNSVNTCPPIVTTETPDIGVTTATLNGTINPNGLASTLNPRAYFRYRSTASAACVDTDAWGTKVPAIIPPVFPNAGLAAYWRLDG